jgi:hypothetical protein
MTSHSAISTTTIRCHVTMPSKHGTNATVERVAAPGTCLPQPEPSKTPGAVPATGRPFASGGV